MLPELFGLKKRRAHRPEHGTARRDLFLSYAREDAACAEALAHAFEARGWSVFWDRLIPPGVPFEEYIEQQLTAARVVVVLWSFHSIASNWVKLEAGVGRDRTPPALVPVLIDSHVTPDEIPFAFRNIQAADLSDWDAGAHSAAFEALVTSIGNLVMELDGPQIQLAQKPRAIGPTLGSLDPWPRVRWGAGWALLRRFWMHAAAVVAVVVIVLMLGTLMRDVAALAERGGTAEHGGVAASGARRDRSRADPLAQGHPRSDGQRGAADIEP